MVVAARSALGLLDVRAKAATASGKAGDVSWPECSEYDCFSCHLDPENNSWLKQPRACAEDVTGGAPPWGTWYYPMVLTLAQAGSGDEPKSFGSFFEQLHATMGEPIPLPARVVDETNQAAQALDRWIRSLAHEPFDAWKVRRLIDAVDASAAKDATRSWDQVAQRLPRPQVTPPDAQGSRSDLAR